MNNRILTAEDVAMILELRTEGVRMDYIARYVYGVSAQMLRGRMKRWIEPERPVTRNKKKLEYINGPLAELKAEWQKLGLRAA